MNAVAFDRIEDRSRAMLDIEAWAAGGLSLQKAEGSAAFRLVTAWAEKNVLWLTAPRGEPAAIDMPTKNAPHIFVVQHDWASAFKGAQDFDSGDFQLPYDETAFEFRISGKRVIALINEDVGNRSRKIIFALVECGPIWVLPIEPFVLLDGHWRPYKEDPENPVFSLPMILAAQVKAVCVSLEAEVATSDTVTTPAKLMAAQLRRGKQPLPEYNIVRLNRAPRQRLIGVDCDHPTKRLHFRRGHWRHLTEDRKTWVRWCLVGNPDLGFIDKQYRL